MGTKTFPVSKINKVLTVELIMQEVRPHPHAWAAFALLAILVNKRSNGEGPWIEITGVEWRERTGGTLQKGRGAGALQDLGLAMYRREGLKALQFRLAARVDPVAVQRKIEKAHRRRRKEGSPPVADRDVVSQVVVNLRKKQRSDTT